MNDNQTKTEMPEAPVGSREPEESPAAAKAGLVGATIGWLGRVIPTALVLAALGALAVWGHHSGWTIPKFSEVAGNSHSEKDDWCGAHGVPGSQCVECKPDLLPRLKSFGWCRTHGVHECPLEHPEVAQLPVTPRI